MKSTWKPVLVLAISTALVGAAAAGPALAQGGRFGHGPGDGGPGPHGMMQRVLERLDLTEDQRAEAEALFAERHEAMQAEVEQLRSTREALFDTIHAAEIDEAAIREAAAAVAAVEADLAVKRAQANQEFRKILTEEQRVRLDEMQKALRSFQQEFGGRHHGHGFGPRGPRNP